jgi:multiple sugar transport system permease protein
VTQRSLSSPPTKSAHAGRRKGSQLFRRILFIALLIGCTLLFMIPFLWLLSASLKIRSEVFNSEWFPNPIAWDNYLRVWQAAPLLSWLNNSVIVGVLSALTVTISSSLVAFGFANFRFPGRDALFGLVLATMMLPGAVTMIPVYLIWNKLGFVNTLVPLWAGNLFGSAFYIFLLRQFYLTLPRDLFEAARVDGANFFQIWWRIATPLTSTALIVVFIFEFKASWTDLMKPLIYLYDTPLFTMPRGIKALVDQFGQGGELQWEIVLAATVILTLPMVLIFFLAQRYFVEGIATTGTKG